MTLTNEQRSQRCARALAIYSDDDYYTNLVDWLADAMHWCHSNDHNFADAIDSASMHFDTEIVEAIDQGSSL
jgi:hypothetical protein